MNFDINANQKVTFFGKSGAGKTTIFSLIIRLYSINDGKILIDGNDIRDLTCDSLRNNMSSITQNPYIYIYLIFQSKIIYY